MRAALAILACLALASEELRSQRGGITGGVELARAYEAVFDARFEALPPLLATTCPPAPGLFFD